MDEILLVDRDDENYFGTPDDARMMTSFEEIFGAVHIGTGATTSHARVTELEFTRWRATIFGTYSQRKLLRSRAMPRSVNINMEVDVKPKEKRLGKASML